MQSVSTANKIIFLMQGLFEPKQIMYRNTNLLRKIHLRGPFAKFVDSPYYSESELCGGAMTVSACKPIWATKHMINGMEQRNKFKKGDEIHH
jgi:hypothetical protein